MIDRTDAESAVGRDLLVHADVLHAERRRVRVGTLTRAAFAYHTLSWLWPEVATLLAAGSAERREAGRRLPVPAGHRASL